MKHYLYLLYLSAGLAMTACATSKTAGRGSRTTTDAAPRITGSNNIPQSYYDNARRTVEPFRVADVSTDATYGVTQKNPVCVGGATTDGVRNQQRYLNALRGPQGEEISYRRRGSCCPFKTPNGLIEGMGMLDAYEITWAGNDKPVLLYLNFYDEGPLHAPVGLTLAQP
ncbi:hypothetical protein [Hymenobacter persicinus]|uniref:2-dehydro-3-deoxyphosphooctonate aldolase n=1 Tax=Hymenobacter persicinus TaxID=2025506 RepID=A0A4Q5LF52_9BACT|nr:hypothetical protein [Hymenobacter persicinus]RYU83264.1 hypothetical protein EWM57_02965 [Hymenobacter persicinus]